MGPAVLSVSHHKVQGGTESTDTLQAARSYLGALLSLVIQSLTPYWMVIKINAVLDFSGLWLLFQRENHDLKEA